MPGFSRPKSQFVAILLLLYVEVGRIRRCFSSWVAYIALCIEPFRHLHSVLRAHTESTTGAT